MNEIDGLHLIVDGLVEEPDRVFQESHLRDMLNQLVEDLDMQLIFGPQFLNVQIDSEKLIGDVFQDEGGLSGFCMIGTSHISIHVWPLRRHFSADVFSCKQFNEHKARETIWKFLQPVNATFLAVRRRQGGAIEESSPMEKQVCQMQDQPST